jgi:hypothetical protein
MLTAMAFMVPAAFVTAGVDANRDSLRQAWATVQAQEKKDAAVEKATAQKLTSALTTPKAKAKAKTKR